MSAETFLCHAPFNVRAMDGSGIIPKSAAKLQNYSQIYKIFSRKISLNLLKCYLTALRKHRKK